MKTAINTQSQNEVKDLLNEYVVSPLNTDITLTLEKIQQEIEGLKITTTEEIGKVSPSVNGNINRLKQKLDTSFHFEDEEDAFESIKNEINENCEDINQNLNGMENELTDISSLVKNTPEKVRSDIKIAEKNLHDDIEKNEKAVQMSLSDYFRIVDSKLEKSITVTDREIEEIKIRAAEFTQLVNLKAAEAITALADQTKDFSQIVQTNHLEIKKELNEIISNRYDDLLTRINELEQTITTDFNKSDVIIAKYNDSTISAIDESKAEIKELTHKKYKTMSTISLLFGIANFLGIISMIILCFAK